MPLSAKGNKILNAMRYGDEKKAKSVFYASINAGKITGAEKGRQFGGAIPPFGGYAFGGLLPGPTANPVGSYFARQAMRNLPRTPRIHMGPIGGATMGRGDKVGMHVAPGSYVLPADHVSGLGQGNTHAGFKVLNQMFGPHTGPMGMTLPRIPRGGVGIPHVKPPKLAQTGGGMESDGEPIEIQAADGEYVLTPHQIINKFGDLKRGHKALDAWVEQHRQEHIKKLKSLPGPVKD